jgi:hypothetical protein
LEFYPHIGIGGIMAAALYVGGDNMMKSVGHYVGQKVATSLIHIPHLPSYATAVQNLPSKNYHTSTKQRLAEAMEFRQLLQVLSTHTMTWRSSIHGSMWGMIQVIIEEGEKKKKKLNYTVPGYKTVFNIYGYREQVLLSHRKT